jgi:hypothetical protein
MVHSSALAVSNDVERLTCAGFSLGETICFGSLEFIINCFSGLSLSPKGSDPGTVFMGTTCNGSPSLRTTIKDSTEEFYMTSSGEGSSDLLVSRRHDTRALLAPVTTMSWLEDARATQAMTTVPPWGFTTWPGTDLSFER